MATTDRTLFGRAAANLARGLGGSLPLAMLPPLLARELPSADFAVWVLVVQFAGYVAYLEFGLQTAVSKTVAASFAVGGLKATRGPSDAGVRLLMVASVIGLVGVGVGVVLLPTLFDVPSELTAQARAALVILGLGAAIALPASAAHGALLGIGRNDLSAFVIVICRLPSVIVTAIGASLGWTIPQLALVLAAGSVANVLLSFVVSRAVGLPIGVDGGSKPQRKEILGLTATFGVFTIATLLITGLDVVVVGAVDFDQVAAYGLGASLVTVIAAGYTLVATVLLPAFADAAARGELGQGRKLASRSTRLGSWVLVVGLVFSFAIEPVVSELWAGSYAGESGAVFLLLMAATAVRLSVSPISQFVIGIGDHRAVRLPAAGEAVLNLTLSIALGLWMGAIGVAVATLIAAIAAVSYYLIRLMPHALGREESARVLRSAFLVPVAVAAVSIPLILVHEPALSIGVVIAVALLGAAQIRRIGRAGAPGQSPSASASPS